jgi:hypothetical protein
VSKLVAGREKDLDFVAGLLRHGLTKAEVIRRRLESVPISPDHRDGCVARLNRIQS